MRYPDYRHVRAARSGFTLIELLVAVAIIGLLISILLPALSAARQRAKAVKCLSNLRVLGQGMVIYCNENQDVLPAGRLPKISGDNCNPYGVVYGLHKFRPTFLVMMSGAVGAPPFADPKACRTETDMFGQPGDRQDYSFAVYVCPSVSEWTDERNAAYGFNYHFLGNSRVRDVADPTSYKNWPVKLNWIKHPGRTVAVADGMGTAAAFAPEAREPYTNSPPTQVDGEAHLGNEGFNLDPPRVDAANGEMASAPDRSGVDPRHSSFANVLWLDGHAAGHTPKQLGYLMESDGSFADVGDNSLWSGSGRDVAWTPGYRPYDQP